MIPRERIGGSKGLGSRYGRRARGGWVLEKPGSHVSSNFSLERF